jgi:hypothetical protein
MIRPGLVIVYVCLHGLASSAADDKAMRAERGPAWARTSSSSQDSDWVAHAG